MYVPAAQSCPTLQPRGLEPARLPCPWDSPGKKAGVGSHFLLQGIFLTQGANPGLLPCRQILYHLSHWEAPGKRTGPKSITEVLTRTPWEDADHRQEKQGAGQVMTQAAGRVHGSRSSQGCQPPPGAERGEEGSSPGT